MFSFSNKHSKKTTPTALFLAIFLFLETYIRFENVSDAVA
jgi:hypothetical protein